jgi:soluble lytic murein transglycosylase-like protein
MPMRFGLVAVVLVLALTWSGLLFACWDEAAARYQISPELLHAIAICESGLRPSVVSHNINTGTYDIGLMQINSSNLRRLKSYGINEDQLYEPCTNLQVGAWILAGEFQRHGFSWEAVGAYNAACTGSKLQDCTAVRARYAWCVYMNLPVPSTSASLVQRSPSRTNVPQVAPIIATRVAR